MSQWFLNRANIVAVFEQVSSITSPNWGMSKAAPSIRRFRRRPRRSRRQQRLNEFKAIKGAQVTDRFAGTDEADRQLGF